MGKIQMTQREQQVPVSLSLEHWVFVFVSVFDIRISNLINLYSQNRVLWAKTKTGFPGPHFSIVHQSQDVP